MSLCIESYNGDDFFVKVYETGIIAFLTLSSASSDSPGWHKLLSKILDGAYLLAQTIEAGESVLCHCSDGWDRTAQLTAVAMIMLDPYYRTFDGFLVCFSQHSFPPRILIFSAWLRKNGSASAINFIWDWVCQLIKRMNLLYFFNFWSACII
jgi:hypothetical protein